MAQKIKFIVLADGGKYYMIANWNDISNKPDLLTETELLEYNFISKHNVESLIQRALKELQ